MSDRSAKLTNPGLVLTAYSTNILRKRGVGGGGGGKFIHNSHTSLPGTLDTHFGRHTIL